MTKLIILTLAILVSPIFANSLEGEVTFDKKESKGILFIFAKKFDGSMRMPLAVKRIVNPRFPVKFSLTAKDAMIKSIPFKGPFKVIARLTKNGDVMDKSGPEGSSVKSLEIGSKNIKIKLK